MQAARFGRWSLLPGARGWFFLVPLVGLMAACGEPDTTGILLIGHGGLGPDAPHPMNSQEAIMGALEQGLDGVEIDVQLTKDSLLVAHHDHALSSNGCSGRIHDHTWDELQECIRSEQAEGAFHVVLVTTLIEELNHRCLYKIVMLGGWKPAQRWSILSLLETGLPSPVRIKVSLLIPKYVYELELVRYPDVTGTICETITTDFPLNMQYSVDVAKRHRIQEDAVSSKKDSE